MKIPEKGLEKNVLFEKMEQYRTLDTNWREGRTFGYVYDAGKDVDEVGKKAYMMFLSENALDPTVYPSLLRFETEIVSMARAHLNGDDEVTGNFTSGGTESCMLAVKTARDYARAHKPHITAPEVILPVTAHAAFHKAAHYFCVKPVIVPVDPVTFKADMNAVEKAITPNTIQLVGSAVSYAHGVVDPIREMGQLALKHDLLLHVDGCIGAFLLPYFKRFGAPVDDFDFQVPGVTSISMDLHKYAFCPKNASVLLYRNRGVRIHQIFTCSQWTGYTVINPTFQSSKSGGPLAAAWAVMNYLGDEGYTALLRPLFDATRQIREGVRQIEGLRVMGDPVVSLVAVTSDTVNIFHIIDEMKVRGWYIQPQLRTGPYQENFHLSINPSNVPWVERLLADLAECTEIAKGMGPAGLDEGMRQLLATLTPETMDEATVMGMLQMAGVQGLTIPDRMATINGILNALPAEIANRLLTVFFNELVHPME